jgi:hypothetical protein
MQAEGPGRRVDGTRTGSPLPTDGGWVLAFALSTVSRAMSAWPPSWVAMTVSTVRPSSAPVSRRGRGVDHHPSGEEGDDQPDHAARDNVRNRPGNGADYHTYGYSPEELATAQSEPLVA